ncbi:MAG: SpoIIE family protein phosphatase [Rubrobacter sp.]|nr:SpoIIE family protein phosphatase [Rubrobacter sp.]
MRMEKSPGGIFGSSWNQRGAEELRLLLDRAVSASYNGIVISDPSLPDNPIIYANRSFMRTTGYEFDEVIGENCRFLQRDDNEQPALDELREAIAGGRECRAVIRNYKKNGEMFWNELYVSPVLDDDGEVTNFIGVQHDVTERKEVEEERDLLLAREQLAKAEAVAARRRLSFLVEADNILLSSVGFFERLRDTARLAVPALADWCLVDIVEDDGGVVQAAASHADEGKHELLRELQRHRSFEEGSNGVAARVLRTGKAETISGEEKGIVEDLASGEESLRLLGELGVSSLVSVPLLARGRVLGVVTLVSSSPERIYGDEDLALAESLAYRCALAVDNAGLYRERSRIARTLQRSLLPRLPEVGEVDVGVEYLPLGEETEIGGDFYDLIRAPNGSLIAVVGDVCGKGPDAAAVAALSRYTIQAVVMNEDSPAKILSALNKAMLRQLDDLKFSTITCARLEKAEGENTFDLTVSRGGHPAPLVHRFDGRIEKIEMPGRVLGVFDDPGVEERVVRLFPGDAAVFYTDGLTEARAPDGSLFGEERLLDLLRECGEGKAAEIAECLKDAVHDFDDGVPLDDLAVLVLKTPK